MGAWRSRRGMEVDYGGRLSNSGLIGCGKGSLKGQRVEGMGSCWVDLDGGEAWCVRMYDEPGSPYCLKNKEKIGLRRGIILLLPWNSGLLVGGKKMKKK